eukprot:UN21500
MGIFTIFKNKVCTYSSTQNLISTFTSQTLIEMRNLKSSSTPPSPRFSCIFWHNSTPDLKHHYKYIDHCHSSYRKFFRCR